MTLDELGVIERTAFELAKDLLRTRDQYHPHDPELAAAFSSRAYEICADFDIDCALIESMLDNQQDESSAEPIARLKAAASPAPDDQDETSNQVLNVILGKQRELVGDQFR